jgi:hypothetical protein
MSITLGVSDGFASSRIHCRRRKGRLAWQENLEIEGLCKIIVRSGLKTLQHILRPRRPHQDRRGHQATRGNLKPSTVGSITSRTTASKFVSLAQATSPSAAISAS